MTRRRRRLLWLLGAGLGGPPLALGLGALLLATEPGNALARRALLDQARAALPEAQLELDGLRFNWLTTLELDGLRLRTADGRPLVSVERLAISYDLRGVLRRELHVRRLRLTRPEVHLTVLPGGQLDLEAALGLQPSPPSAAPPSAWGGLPGHVIVDALVISEGSFAYIDGETRLELGELGLQVQGEVQGRHAALRELALALDLRAPYAVPLRLSGDLAYHEGDLALDGLTLRADHSALALSGTLARLETDPRPDLRLELSPLVAAHVNHIAGTEVLGQDVALRLAVQGPQDALSFQGGLTAPAGTLDLRGTADLRADPLAWSLTLVTPGLDLSALLPAVSEPTRLSGSYSATGTGLRWPETPGDAAADLLRGTVQINTGPQVLWGEPVSSLTAEAELDAGKVKIRRLDASVSVGRVRAEGTVDAVGAQADVAVRAAVPALDALARYGVTGLSGAATLDGRVTADWSRPDVSVQAQGTLQASALGVPGDVQVQAATLPFDVTVEGSRVSLHGPLEAAGIAAPGVAVGRAAGEVQLEVGDEGWSVTLPTLEIGAVQVPDADLTLEAAQGSVSVRSVGPDTALDLGLNLTGLALPGDIHGGGGVSGSLTGDHLVASVNLYQAPDQPLLLGEITGDLSGAWVIDGLVIAPTPDTTLTATGPARFTLAEDGLSDVLVDLRGPVGGLRVDGSLRRGAPAVAIDLDSLDLARVGALARRWDPESVPEGLAGKLSFHGEADPDPLALSGEATLRELVYPGVLDEPMDAALHLAQEGASTHLDGHLDHGKIRWATLGGDLPLALDLEGGSLGFSCDDTLGFRLIVAPLEGRELARVLPAARDAAEALALDLVASGPGCDPDLRLVASVQKRLEDQGRVVRMDLEATRAGEDVRVSGGMDLDMVRRLQVEGTARTGLGDVLAWVLRGAPAPNLHEPATWVRDLDLSLVPMGVPLGTIAEMIGAPGAFSGTLVGGVQIGGQVLSPSVTAGLQWVGGRVGGSDLSMAFLGLVPTEPGYDLAVQLGFADGGGLDVSGVVPFDHTIALDQGLDPVLQQDGLALTVGGEGLPLQALLGLVPGLVEADGLARLAGTVGGSLADPAVDLGLRIDGGELVSADTDVRYEDIQLDLGLRPQALTLRTLELYTRPRYGAGLRRGALRADGDLGREGDVGLRATLTDFHASATADESVTLSGALLAEGRWPALRVSGDTRLGTARVRLGKEFFLSDTSLELDPALTVHRAKAEVVTRGPPVPASWEQIQLDLGVDLARSLHLGVEAPTEGGYGEQFADLSTVTLDADLDGELRLLGTAGAPIARGEVETVRGDLGVLGVSFTLQPQGTISFVGDDIGNPILDLSATRSTGTYGDVDVRVTGDAAHVEMAFSSETYPDQADLMSLLLFGKPASELTDSEGEAKSALLSAAISSLTGQVERVIGLSALDQFEIDPSSGAVRVGKALSDDLFLRLEILPSAEDGENQAQATVEWLIQRRLYAEFVTGDKGVSSADLYWRWRF